MFPDGACLSGASLIWIKITVLKLASHVCDSALICTLTAHQRLSSTSPAPICAEFLPVVMTEEANVSQRDSDWHWRHRGWRLRAAPFDTSLPQLTPSGRNSNSPPYIRVWKKDTFTSSRSQMSWGTVAASAENSTEQKSRNWTLSTECEFVATWFLKKPLMPAANMGLKIKRKKKSFVGNFFQHPTLEAQRSVSLSVNFTGKNITAYVNKSKEWWKKN